MGLFSENKFTFIGNAGKKPELKVTGGGKDYAVWSIAVDESYKPKDSTELVKKTEWFNLIVYGALAKIVAEKLVPGQPHYVTGNVGNNEWTDDAGNSRKSTTFTVRKVIVFRKGSGAHDISDEMGPPRDDDEGLATF